MRWREHVTTQARLAFFESTAPELVAAAVGPLPRWAGPRPMSAQFAFFGGDDTLAIVSWPGAPKVSVDEALAWGLAYGHDRDVVLLLPEGTARPTLQRLPWVNTPVQVFTFGTGTPYRVAPAVIPARAEVLAQIASWGARGTGGAEQLGAEQAAWVQELVAWVEARSDLSPRHRQSYLAWHNAGRQVLKITRTQSSLSIDAGVRYSNPTPDQPTPPPTLRLQRLLTDDEFVEIQATIDQAITRRASGDDIGHEEHRLQHRIQREFESVGEVFGLRQLHREFPAWRPGKSPGYIDFLGATDDRVPHIVETKLGNDPMLALQGLDYWIWASANPDIVATTLGGPIKGAPMIDFVVGAYKTTKAVGPYTLRQLEAFDGAIPWRCHVAADWHTQLQIKTLTVKRVPDPPDGWAPVQPPRYAQRLHAHLTGKERPVLLDDGPFYRSPQGGLVEAARPAWDDLQARQLLHRYAHHVRSSQLFALNLFAGLEDDARVRLATLAGIVGVAATEEAIFEFEDLEDRLGEATSASPHRTQVDAAMRCASTDGTRTLLLIEVKLSEVDFGCCSAYQAIRNDSRDTCRTTGPFGNDPARCFQLRNHDRGKRRLYNVQLGPTSSTANGCTFRLGTNQPMRNIALGRALIAAGETDQVVLALAAPRSNPTIWRRWSEAKAALAGIPNTRLADLPADSLLTLHKAGRSAELARRYLLQPISR